MSLISLNNVHRSYGLQVVLEGVSFTINRGEHVGLVGRNGTGKSTILRLIMGTERPDRGAVTLQPRLRISKIEQDPNLDPNLNVYQAVLGGRPELVAMEQQLRELEAALGDSSANHEAVLEQYGSLQHEFDRLGGHEFHGKAAAVLAGLGLPLDMHDRPVAVLSGGQKTRLALARLLLSDPDVLLLDEPTNHLDLEATEWLQGFLERSSATLLLVSHDRYLLDAVCTQVVELENRVTFSYPGNYTAFLQQKAERMERQTELFERQQQQVQKLENFIRKYKAGDRSRQAKSREKALARMDLVDRPRDARTARLNLGGAVARSGRDVVSIRDVSKAFDNLTLFEHLNVTVERGDRIGLVGPNGAGKTTLIRMIMGREQPTAGELNVGTNVHVGYFSQDFQTLGSNRSIIEDVIADSELDIPAARSMLARFLFTDEDVFKNVGDLSGGERNRVALCKLLLSRPNFLLLDEPTNHLDIATREGLITALEEFQGTIMVASHDRFLLDRITDRTLEVAGGQAKLFAGGYSDYRRQRFGEGETPGMAAARVGASQSGGASQPGGGARSSPRPGTGLAVNARHGGGAKPSSSPALARPKPPTEKKPAAASPQRLEKQIAELEKRLAGLTERMNDPELYKSPEMMSVVEEYDRVRVRLDSLYEEWTAASA